jgi:hypothetical protein
MVLTLMFAFLPRLAIAQTSTQPTLLEVEQDVRNYRLANETKLFMS